MTRRSQTKLYIDQTVLVDTGRRETHKQLVASGAIAVASACEADGLARRRERSIVGLITAEPPCSIKYGRLSEVADYCGCHNEQATSSEFAVSGRAQWLFVRRF
jgi:hypothetical protein